MSKKETLRAIEDELSCINSKERLNRASSITVGTCFNGTCEITMRGPGKFLWSPMQPTEMVELINQMAASIGCHIHIQPRDDFGSWRKWNPGQKDLPAFSNFPPNASNEPNRIGSPEDSKQEADKQLEELKND